MPDSGRQPKGISGAQKFVILLALILVAYLVSSQFGCPMVERSEKLEWEHNDR